MTDTEILNSVMDDLKWHASRQRPISPLLAGDLIRSIEQCRHGLKHHSSCSNQNVLHPMGAYDDVEKCGCQSYTNGTSFSDKTVSDFYKKPGPYSEHYAGPEWIDSLRDVPGYGQVRVRSIQKPIQDITKDTQRFWRCAHHPEAIANWAHDIGWHCEHGCDTSELRWWNNGTCTQPTSSN